MRGFVALLVLLTLTAGCLDFSEETFADDPSPTLAFQDVVQLPGDQVGAEPNLVAGPDGEVWVVAPGSSVEGANVHRSEVSLWYSADAGAAWESLRTPAPRDPDGAFCSCDADIDLGPDGQLYLTDFWVSPGLNGFVVEASTDGGRTWGPGNFMTVTNPVANDRQYITAGDEPGEVYLSYARGTAVPAPPTGTPLGLFTGGLHLLRSTDGGTTFGELAKPYEPDPGTFAFIGKMRQAPNGDLLFPWAEITGDAWNASASMVVARSSDDGVTWEEVVAGTAPNGVGGLWPLAADVGPDGMVHVAWMEQGPDNNGSAILYTWSQDGGESYATPRVVSWTSGGTAFLPWIAHAGDARAILTWYGAPETVVPTKAPADQPWDAWATVAGPDEPGTEPSRISPFPVKVGRFCPRGAACGADRELLDYGAIGWRDGWVHAAFAVSILDEGAGPDQRSDEPTGGHSTAAHVWYARARLA